MELDITAVLASNEGILPSVSSEGFTDCQAMSLLDDDVVEPFVCRLDLNSAPHPAALNILLIDLKLQCGSVLFNNLENTSRC